MTAMATSLLSIVMDILAPFVMMTGRTLTPQQFADNLDLMAATPRQTHFTEQFRQFSRWIMLDVPPLTMSYRTATILTKLLRIVDRVRVLGSHVIITIR